MRSAEIRRSDGRLFGKTQNNETNSRGLKQKNPLSSCNHRKINQKNQSPLTPIGNPNKLENGIVNEL